MRVSNPSCGFFLFVNAGTASKSNSRVGVRPPRSRTVSPSVGSFQLLGTKKLESEERTRSFSQENKQGGFENEEQHPTTPIETSPKRRRVSDMVASLPKYKGKGSVKVVASDFAPDGGWVPKAVPKTVPSENAKVQNLEKDDMEEADSPEMHKQRKIGAKKKRALDTVHEEAIVRRLQEELPPSIEDDETLSEGESGDEDSGKQKENDEDEATEEEQNSPEPEVVVQRRGAGRGGGRGVGRGTGRGKDRKGKTPVQERVSVSTKTRAALTKATRKKS